MNDSANSEHPEYLEAWSLRCHPFEDRLDSQFFYAGSALMQRLDLLTHLVQFGESVVVVSGPRGSGKSSLLEQFLGQINPQWDICLMDAESGDQLSDRLAEIVGGSAEDDEQSMLTRWAAQTAAPQHLVVVIDNAEQLDNATCQQLCELAGLPEGERLRIVLFGTADTQQRVRTMLEKLASKRTCQTLDVPKLTEEETASYLMYRLAVAGYSGESPFTPTEVRAMCKAADGRPGEINQLAHESLIEHHLRAKNKNRAPARRSTAKNSVPVWIGASIGIIAIAGYLGWQRLTPTTGPDHDIAPPQVAFSKMPLELPPTPLSADSIDDAPAPLPEPPSPEAQVADTPALVTETADIDTPVETVVDEVKSITPSPIVTADTIPPDATSEAKPEASAAPVITAAPAASTKPIESDTPSPRSAVPTGEQPAAIRDEPVTLPAPAPKDATITEKAAAVPPSPEQPLPASAPNQPHREDWLLQQQPTAFTLQLLGSREQSSIPTYIKRNALETEKTAYYRGRYRDADWYVLLYGIYPDKAAALAARSTLPDKVQKAKPWPRSLKSVQDSIHETP